MVRAASPLGIKIVLDVTLRTPLVARLDAVLVAPDATLSTSANAATTSSSPWNNCCRPVRPGQFGLSVQFVRLGIAGL
ncbi:MAG: hypothetical protein ACUVSB_13265, partial [Anaerolineae bacterium]